MSKDVLKDIDRTILDMSAEEYVSLKNNPVLTYVEEFEKRRNIKAKNYTTISTAINPREDHAADALSEFARFKLREQNAVYGLDTGEGEDQTAWKTVKIDLPKTYLNISEDLDSVLESSDLMKELNELCIRDTQELYVRELLNRLYKIIEYCDNWKIVDQVDYDIKPYMDYIVEMARGKEK